ncbi:hypothetical protein IM40_08530 [Candidatus Paracaedimonas acanthamoebae]|nr:hypothetical protein IM40_08530 [Candidatus Paracaedimonas acanthamoebae]
MHKIFLKCLVVFLFYNSCPLKASNMTLEGLEEFCVKSSPCYYSNGLWHHYEPESLIDPWGPTGVAIGAVGLVAAIAVPLTDRLVDWIIHKCSSQGSRWAKIDTMEATLNSIQRDQGNQLATITAEVNGIQKQTDTARREISNGLEEAKAFLEEYYAESNKEHASQLKEMLSEVGSIKESTESIDLKVSKGFKETMTKIDTILEKPKDK